MKTIIILSSIAIVLFIINKLANKVDNYNKKYPKSDKPDFYYWKDRTIDSDDECKVQCPRCKNVQDERFE